MGLVKIDDELHEQVRAASTVMCRSINAQAEFWMKIGRLAEANPLTGALKFELEQGASSRIEPRGTPMALQKRGKHTVGKRGRPGNIRHQGRGKR